MNAPSNICWTGFVKRSEKEKGGGYWKKKEKKKVEKWPALAQAPTRQQHCYK